MKLSIRLRLLLPAFAVISFAGFPGMFCRASNSAYCQTANPINHKTPGQLIAQVLSEPVTQAGDAEREAAIRKLRSIVVEKQKLQKSQPTFAPGTARISERIRYIPFSDLQQILNQKPGGYFIPKADYEAMKSLKEAYLATRPESPSPEISSDFIFGHVDYRGTLQNRVCEFEAIIYFELPNEKWVSLPLPSGDIAITEALLDGKPTGIHTRVFQGIQDSEAPKGKVQMLQDALAHIKRTLPSYIHSREGKSNSYFLTLHGPGKHELRLKMTVPQVENPQSDELTFQIPRFPSAGFEILLDKPNQFAEVDRAEGLICREQFGKTSVHGILGPTDRFTLRWAPKSVSVPALKDLDSEPEQEDQPESDAVHEVAIPRIISESDLLISIGEGYIRSDASINLKVTRAPVEEISFIIPKTTEVISIQAQNSHPFQIEQLATASRVILRFAGKMQSQIEINMICDTKMADTTQAMEIPVHITENADRDTGHIAVEARTSVEIIKHPRAFSDKFKVSFLDVSELPPSLTTKAQRPLLLGFRYLAPPKNPIILDVERHLPTDTLHSIIEHLEAKTVFSTDQTAITHLSMRVKSNGKQYLDALLNRDCELKSANVDNFPVKPTNPNDDKAIVRIPMQKTGVSRAGQDSFTVEMVYNSTIPQIRNSAAFSYPLPLLDMPIQTMAWTLYAPERYVIMPGSGTVSLPFRSLAFIPFDWVHSFFSQLTTQDNLLLIGILLVLFLIGRIVLSIISSRFRQTENRYLKFALPSAFAIILLLFLVSLAGPMISSITDSKSAVFVRPELQYQSIPSGSAVNEDKAMGDRFCEDEYSSMEISGKKELSRLKSFEKRLPQKPMTSESRHTARDDGALPVGMLIPTTGSHAFAYKRIVDVKEKMEYTGTFLWRPLWQSLSAALFLAGTGAFLIIFACVRSQHAFTSLFLFIVFACCAVFIENKAAHSQIPFLAGFIAALALALIYNLSRAIIKYRTISCIAIIISLCFLPGAASASDYNPRVENTIDIYIPYQQLDEKLPRNSSMVFLSAKEYEYLRDIGLKKPDPAKWTPPVSVTFVSANLKGHVHENRVELHMRIEVQLLGKGFKWIPFPTEGLGLRELKLDGRPALLGYSSDNSPFNSLYEYYPASQQIEQQAQQMQQISQTNMAQFFDNNLSPNHGLWKPAIVTDKEGHVTIEAIMVKDLLPHDKLSGAAEGFTLPLPPGITTSMNLIVNRPEQSVEIKPSASVITEDRGSQTEIRAILQPSDKISVKWRDKTKTITAPIIQDPNSGIQQAATPAKPKVFVDHEILFSITEGIISIADHIRMNIEQGPAGEFAISLPQGVDLIDVTGKDIASWTAGRNASDTELTILLNARRLGQISLVLLLERQTPEISGEFMLDIPELTKAGLEGTIERQKGYFGIEAAQGLTVEIKNFSPATSVDIQELPDLIRSNAKTLVSGFKYLRKPLPAAVVMKHRAATVSTANIDDAVAQTTITNDGKVFTRLSLSVKNNNNQFLMLSNSVKHGKLLSVTVNGEPVKPGLNKAGDISIPLILSPRSGSDFRPFPVVLFFLNNCLPLETKGTLDLAIPPMSMDISRMDWIVYAPEVYFLVGEPGDFQPGRSRLPVATPAISTGKSMSKFSNVLSQASINPVDMKEAANGGMFPVVLGIPTTSKFTIFNRNLIVAGSDSLILRLRYGRESIARAVFILISLVFAGLVAFTIRSIHRHEFRKGLFSISAIACFALGVYCLEYLFSDYIPLLADLRKSFLLGLQTGIIMPVIWFFLAYSPPPIPKQTPEGKSELEAETHNPN